MRSCRLRAPLLARIALRALGVLGVLGTPAGAAGLEGPTRPVRDAEGRVTLTVPAKWNEKPVSGNQVLRVQAPGSYGGHDLIVVREAGQDDRDRQRERYLGYDSGRLGGATVQKVDDPFYGYRLNHPETNRVIVRSFVTDGADGLVLSVSSRFQYYDKFYASQIAAILGTLTISKGAQGARSELEGALRRVHDPEARVSLVAPDSWKPIETQSAGEMLLLGLKGARSGPRLLLKEWGGPTSVGLVLLKVSAQWKRAYAGIIIRRLGMNPPRMLVKNRVPGSVDYLTAFEANQRGYTLMLTCREGAYERYRGIADQVSRTVVFAGGAYAPADPMPGDLHKAYKSVAVVHARSEDAKAADEVAGTLDVFERNWARIGVGQTRKSPPIHILLARPERFREAAHHFGEPPATYDPLRCAVVVVPPPTAADELEMWRGRLCKAMAEAALHRDLRCEPPPWLLFGLAACMDAAGRDGKSADAAHPLLVRRLVLKTSTDSQASLLDVEAMTRADFVAAESPDAITMAWGYVHLMNYGRSALSSFYKRWVKALAKAKGATPPFDRKTYKNDRVDLKKHVLKRWGE